MTAEAQPTAPATLPVDLALAAKLEQLGKRDRRVHDPSTFVKCKDEYWFFSTGRGIQSHRSRDMKTWESGPPIFTQRPAWTLEAVPGNRGGEQGDYWAPDVIHVGGRYIVYYSVSTFGSNVSAIGAASNPTLDPDDPNFKWTDLGMVVQSTLREDYNAIDPAIILDEEGRLWMSFGSFWSGIRLIELDPKTGLRIAPDSPMHYLAHYDSIEAPFIHHNDGYYYLFVNWGLCCRGANSTYDMRIGRSRAITGPYFDKQGRDLVTGGGSPFLSTDGPFIGPGHAGILTEGSTHWLSMHFYDATQRGASMLAIRKLIWGADGWPQLRDD